jgi:hypothetical protein
LLGNGSSLARIYDKPGGGVEPPAETMAGTFVVVISAHPGAYFEGQPCRPDEASRCSARFEALERAGDSISALP